MAVAVIRGLVAALGVVVALAFPAAASDAAGRVADLLRFDEVLEILREEGIEHGVGIGEAMLGPDVQPRWRQAVDRVHDPDEMRELMLDGFRAGLTGGDPTVIRTIEAFVASPLGQRVVELEIGARRAMLDPDVEDAARAAWQALVAEDGPRVALLRRFVTTGDLLERNVVGGLNATVAFYAGLADSGGELAGMAEADMLAEVWAQEPAIRAEVEDWLNAYLALVFSPLDDDDLGDYVDFFSDPAGQVLNTALFSGFNGMFDALSRRLGRVAGMLMQGEEL
ncbi:MAG: DUF2059 domain-containing protein [Alkalilacustris sp.]